MSGEVVPLITEKQSNCEADYWAVGSKYKEVHDANDFCDRLFCFDSTGAPLFKKVGNFTVLKQSKSADGEVTLNIVVGPSWKFLLFVTIPIVTLGPILISLTVLAGKSMAVVILYPACAILCLVTLWWTSTADPGILRRYRQKPGSNLSRNQDDLEAPAIKSCSIASSTSTSCLSTNNDIGSKEESTIELEDASEHEWVWNDQACTWRPNSASYLAQVDAVVENVDHYCPWTGTVIAKKNSCSFYGFISFVFILVYFSIYLVGSALLEN